MGEQLDLFQRKMPVQKPGRSKQDYETPREFIDAVEGRFGKLEVDLAARHDNAKAPQWIPPEIDSLRLEWPTHKRMWLNPPFGNIAVWARKCWEWLEQQGPDGRIFFLVPASVGANWFWSYVIDYAVVFALQPRLSFDGRHPFPKDLILAVYGMTGETSELHRWRWK